ncbi:hypothetical protein Hanom_Chr02g00118301 [Helianthus anomalus]
MVHETHPITGEPLEEGKFVRDLTDDQLKALFKMNDVDGTKIKSLPIESEITDMDNVEQIVLNLI